MNDNRNYEYKTTSVTVREEYGILEKWVKKGSSVIDLGSGDGTLLKMLVDSRQVDGLGVEISPSGIAAAKKKGIRSIVGRIDIKLPFKNKEFDYAICNTTLQMVMYPEVLLLEMKRISKVQIITFPNFAFILNRLELLTMGRMPRFMMPGYKWFSTGHIHQFSIWDFKKFCRDNGMKIVKTAHIAPKKMFSFPRFIMDKNPNLFASMGVFLTTE